MRLTPVLLSLSVVCACHSPKKESEKWTRARGAPLEDFRVAASTVDGDGRRVTLDGEALSQIVDSDGVVTIKFAVDVGKLEEAIDQARADLKAMREAKSTKEPGGEADQPPATLQPKPNLTQVTLRKKAIEDFLTERAADGGRFTMEVIARRTTPSNVVSQLVVPYWTDGEAPEVARRDLPSQIEQKLKELEQELEQGKNSAPQDPQEGVAPTGEATTAEKNLKNIRRSLLGFLPDVRIDLARSGVQRGDRVDIALEFHPGADGAKPPGGGAATSAAHDPDTNTDELAGLVGFHLSVDDLGWSTHVRPQLIFFRSTSGTSDERSWQANAAGLIDWAYRFRSRHSAWQKFVNDWEPALGIHVASLDQGDSSVEVGTGVNLSMMNGLVSVGWGYNLSERDHYYFLGGDLFKLFDKVKDMATK
jgi:hypothetical protein